MLGFLEFEPRPIYPPSVAAMFLTGLLLSCGGDNQATQGSAEEVREESAEALEATQDYLATEASRARDEIESDLKNVKARISELRQRAEETGAAVEHGWDQRMADLEAKAEDLGQTVESMAAEAEETWDDFAARSRRALKELEAGLDHAAQELQKAKEKKVH